MSDRLNLERGFMILRKANAVDYKEYTAESCYTLKCQCLFGVTYNSLRF
jgi:hypothetical protein